MLTCTNVVSPNHLLVIVASGQRQTMNLIVDTCPITKFERGLNLLHEADDDANSHIAEVYSDCSTRGNK